MTPAQILAIVALLSAFNVPQPTIDEVERIMRAPAPVVIASAPAEAIQTPAEQGWCSITSVPIKRDINNTPLEVKLSWEYSAGLSQAKLERSRDTGGVYNELDKNAIERFSFVTDPINTGKIAQGATTTVSTAYQGYRLSFADGTSCTTVTRK